MRSIYAKMLVWFLLTLLVCLAGFVGTSIYLARVVPGPESMMGKLHTVLHREAQAVFQAQGPAALAAHLARLNTVTGTAYYLVDERGRDLATGTDRGEWLAQARQRPARLFFLRGGPRGGGSAVIATASHAGTRLLFALGPPPGGEMSGFLPYYLWILGAVALLVYLLASRFIRPLNALVATVERFGRGDLGARLGWTRHDEFGELGAAFDQMAQRIDTLMTAERRLLQDVSHELRSPLARLNFAVGLGRASNADPKIAMDRIQREADRLARLVDELLEVTRAEGDPATRKFEEVRLDLFVQELADECRVEAQARGCELKLDLERVPVLHADRELLRRAVENVLRNGIRHAPDGSAIDVRVASLPGGVKAEATIRDRGPGVPAAMLGEIFRPFVRVGEDRSRDSGGVGLGLSIAQRAVALHEGRIWAENAAPGLMVHVELPVLGRNGLGSGGKESTGGVV